jgi:hypothetical protein
MGERSLLFSSLHGGGSRRLAGGEQYSATGLHADFNNSIYIRRSILLFDYPPKNISPIYLLLSLTIVFIPTSILIKYYFFFHPTNSGPLSLFFLTHIELNDF